MQFGYAKGDATAPLDDGASPDAPTILGPVYWWDHETGGLIFECNDFAEIDQREA